MKLNVKQTEALDCLEDSITTEILYGGAAGGGKSVLGAYWLTKMCLKYPETRWLMGRSSLKTLKETTLQSFFEVCKMQGLKSGIHYNYVDNPKSAITFFNKSEILLKDLFAYPSDENFDSLGSLEITGAFIDECTEIIRKAKEIVTSRIRYKIRDYGIKGKLLMTCNPSKNWVYDDYYLPSVKGLLDNKKRFIQALPKDNIDNLPDDYKERLEGLNEIDRQRLLDGNWDYDQSKDCLCSFRKIEDCFTNDFESLKGEKYITADVSRLGGDRFVVGLWDGWRVKLKWWDRTKLDISHDYIKKLRLSEEVPLNNVLVDEDGVGGGIVDFLKCKGFTNGGAALPNPEKPTIDEKGHIKPENYANLKSQCYYRLAARINKGGLFIDCEDVEMRELIKRELGEIKQWKMDDDGKKRIIPKEEVKKNIGRSPDFSDTLMMREWFELKAKFVVSVA